MFEVLHRCQHGSGGAWGRWSYLNRLREPHGGEALGEERFLIAAPVEAVGPVDQRDLHVRAVRGASGDLGDEAAQITSRGIILPADFADELQVEEFGGGVIAGKRVRGAGAEDADRVVVYWGERGGGARADDVVVPVALDVDGGVFEGLREEGAAVGGLFFAGEGREDHACGGVFLGADSCHFHYDWGRFG